MASGAGGIPLPLTLGIFGDFISGMGTKIENAAVNYLLPTNSKKLKIINEWGGACLKAQPVFKDNNYQTTTTVFPNLHSCYTTADDPMANDDLHSLESIKKTMLEHDHLFKQQLKELHRLYDVQRLLMKDLNSKMTTLPDQTRILANANEVKQGCFDLQQCVTEPNTSRHAFEENEEEPEIELTLGLGNRKYSSDKEMKKKYQEQPHGSVDLLLCPNSNSDQFQVIGQQKVPSDRMEQSQSAEDFPETVVTSDPAVKLPHWLLHSLGSDKT